MRTHLYIASLPLHHSTFNIDSNESTYERKRTNERNTNMELQGTQGSNNENNLLIRLHR